MKIEDFTSIKGDERHIISVSGKDYVIGKKIGSGSVGKVFEAYEAGKRNVPLVFKEYKQPSREDANFFNMQIIQNTIKKNVIELIKNPIKDSSGNLIPHFVRPIDLIKLKASGGFGCIIERVDTDKYKGIEKLLNHLDQYPDAKEICTFAKALAQFFTNIHAKGWCYKDINEGNIFIDPKTGDFKIFDFDNISIEKDKTILGTCGYIAPEVYQTEKPDRYSDHFSLATYYFRLLVGHFPLDGPYTEKYTIDNNLDISSAAKHIYGSNAVFCFDPQNKSNAAYLSKKLRYVEETHIWNRLPDSVKRNFMQTFVTALPYQKRTLRTRDDQWKSIFDDLERNHLVRCKCGKYAFDSHKKCIFCGAKIVPPIHVPPPPPPPPPPTKYEVVFEYIALVNGQRKKGEIGFPLGQTIYGKRLHLEFPNTPLIMAKHNEEAKIYTVKNLSKVTWEVFRNEKKVSCPPNMEVPIKTDIVIKIDKHRYILKVRGIRKIT